MSDHQLSFEERLRQQGVSRRNFLKFCGLMAATLALPAIEAPRIARALGSAGLTSEELKAMGVNAVPLSRYAESPITPAARPPLVWLEFQGCTGDTESFLHASNPNVSQILLETLSVNYHETLMVPSGALATKSLNDTIRAEHLFVVGRHFGGSAEPDRSCGRPTTPAQPDQPSEPARLPHERCEPDGRDRPLPDLCKPAPDG